MLSDLDREKAIQAFMKVFISRARDGTVSNIMATLEDGPLGRTPPEDAKALHEWFEQLGNQNQEYVRKVVYNAVDSALFACLVILDGATGGYPIKGHLSDFALYLQTYKDEAAELADLPQTRIKLNPWRSTEDLHDIFRWLLEESTQ